jgi:DNA repair exonuclease SbcCD ATPase subunit
MVAADVSQCPVCFHGNDKAHVEKRAADMAALVANRLEDHQMAQADLKSTLGGIDEREAEVLRAKQAYTNATHELDRAKTALRNRGNEVKARLDALRSVVSDVDYIGPTSASIETQLETLHTSDSNRRQLRALMTQSAQVKATHEAATILKGEAQRLLQNTLQQIQSTAEAAVNRYMPTGFTASLDLEGNNCEWRAVSRRDGRPHGKSASGAQRCALVIALALAWTENSPIRILLIDDKELHGFSAANVKSFLSMVKARVDAGDLTQAFAAWSRPDEIPADWMKVTMS